MHHTSEASRHTFTFTCFASPCEVIISTPDFTKAQTIAHTIHQEAKRIETKYTRYTTTSVIGHINQHPSHTTTIDQETHQLLTFANQLYNLTNGMFDITAGVLNTLWDFKQHTITPPPPETITHLQQQVGWHKALLTSNTITLKPQMQLDLGGIGKEYAVDKAAMAIAPLNPPPTLINFGGDLYATNPPTPNTNWKIAIHNTTNKTITLTKGAVATSGDAHNYLIINNTRYAHFLNPKTGYPISSDIRSITVIANTCITAGTIATIAFLNNNTKQQAQEFLQEQQLPFIIL